MSVYVGAAEWPFRRMVMAHLMADTSEELLKMVDLIQVDRKWIQYPGTVKEHFDVSKSKRALAIRFGAKELDHEGEARFINRRRWTEEVVPGVLVVHKPSGLSGRVHKKLWNGVEVNPSYKPDSREVWTWSMVGIRRPRLIKRWPRPFRFPRTVPTLQCHCKIGRLMVNGKNKVKCERCSMQIGSESFPNRIRRATQMLVKAEEQRRERIKPKRKGRRK